MYLCASRRCCLSSGKCYCSDDVVLHTVNKTLVVFTSLILVGLQDRLVVYFIYPILLMLFTVNSSQAVKCAGGKLWPAGHIQSFGYQRLSEWPDSSHHFDCIYLKSSCNAWWTTRWLIGPLPNIWKSVLPRPHSHDMSVSTRFLVGCLEISTILSFSPNWQQVKTLNGFILETRGLTAMQN